MPDLVYLSGGALTPVWGKATTLYSSVMPPPVMPELSGMNARWWVSSTVVHLRTAPHTSAAKEKYLRSDVHMQ